VFYEKGARREELKSGVGSRRRKKSFAMSIPLDSRKSGREYEGSPIVSKGRTGSGGLTLFADQKRSKAAYVPKGCGVGLSYEGGGGRGEDWGKRATG